MSESTAWILDVGQSIRIAIGDLEMVHLEEQPKLHAIPKTPDYCQHVFIWQGNVIPVIDLAIGMKGQDSLSEMSYIAVIRYLSATTGELMQAALLLTKMPVKIKIDDKFACSLPKKFHDLKILAISCFKLEGESIPILDLAAIFSRSARTLFRNELE